ncbi:hypothetical protein [Bradyrhizobium sp. STM 3566]|uniref:hypothetical protein n=1 Tax=Bradyrhizobium sp. STM 3566 TaxID=578928 RepID=UPI00388DDBD0
MLRSARLAHRRQYVNLRRSLARPFGHSQLGYGQHHPSTVSTLGVKCEHKSDLRALLIVLAGTISAPRRLPVLDVICCLLAGRDLKRLPLGKAFIRQPNA